MSIAELERRSPPDLGLRPTERPRLEVVRDSATAGDVPSLLPAVRPCDDARFRPVRRGAPVFDARASATTWLLAERLEALPPAAGQSFLGRWHAHHNDRLHALVADEGCDVRIGGGVVAGGLRLALLAWLPPSRTELMLLEQGLFRDAPAAALTLLVRPPTVWSLGEAVTAARRHPGGPRFEPERFEALERYGRERVRPTHLERLRAAVGRVESRVPPSRFPVASATVAAGCRVIATDVASCRAIAARELARYAMSALVCRAAR